MEIDAEAKRVREFVGEGNYHAAYNVALSAMNACRRADDQAGVDFFIGLIHEIVAALAAEFGSRSGN
jgi:hypothetical protein